MGIKPGEVLAFTVAMLGGLELDPAGEAKAAVARALASKLDACAAKDPVGGDPMAGLAKEWRELVDSILDATGDRQEFVADLFAEVGDT